MDLHRLFLFLIFVFSLGLLWDGWQRHQYPERYEQQEQLADAAAADPSVPTRSVALEGGASLADVSEAKTSTQLVGEVVRVKTDTLEVEINTVGGDISRLAFLKHPDHEDPSQPLLFFESGVGSHNYIAQTGLLGEGLPNHTHLFVAEQREYSLHSGEGKLEVRLKTETDAGLQVVKVLTFHEDSYLIDVRYELLNKGDQPLKAGSYYQLVRNSQPPAGSSFFLPTYTGAAVYTDQEKIEKVNFEEIATEEAEHTKQAKDGWIGYFQHYFVSAWLPEQEVGREYYTRKLDGDNYAAGVILPDVVVDAGANAVINNRLYVGPAHIDLDEIAPGLDLSVDYGWLTPLSKPLFIAMSWLHGYTDNWGWAIVLLTVLIKLAFFPLSAASYRSMAKMRVLTPKLERIRQQYGDDRERLGRAMMDLYKTEKINPLGGCLPILLQIPVFIALYWAILSSVEMRFAPFVGWITDLSSTDPYFILPIVMGLSMVIQMRLNPTPPDPIQAKVMKVMPVMFSVFFFFFPAGLVLYSIVNNLLSITQQWYITRKIEAEKGVSKA